MNIANLPPGTKLELKTLWNRPIYLVVGLGGDCGVYSSIASDNSDPKEPIFLFRTIINTVDLRRNWKSSGQSELMNQLDKFQFYGETEIGNEIYYKTNLDDLSRTIISKAEFDQLELFSANETHHILYRVDAILTN